MGDKYVYLGTKILVNKLNIKDRKLLEKKEKNLSGARLLELRLKNNMKKTFDFNYLKKLHRHIFQDIYSWAGTVRDVNIAKGKSLFCLVEHIEAYGETVFKKIKDADYFKNITDKSELALKLAETMLDINALHPFRDGNGRTQREFIRQLAEERGYELVFDHITQRGIVELSDLTHDPDILAVKFEKGMTRINKNNENS
ncbi:Fic/DOC family protein [Fusobacterium sp.]|uniref:Fic/DOC family protein n=1 Tax=Fusobacterium sp. TaxID=68766 RepID=UPI0029008B1C|nr:Fic family protein [Fusobacterium sp.]MDU1910602.1 Fic family protein [Fusobacterium sp.]